MDMEKKKRNKQIRNYLMFVAAGVVILIVIALLSGCGSKMADHNAGSGQKSVLTSAEIKELQEQAMLDAEGVFDPAAEEEDEEIAGIEDVDGWWENSQHRYAWGFQEGEEVDTDGVLVQLSAEDKVLQTFSAQDLSLFSRGEDEEVEVEGVTDREVICSTNLYAEDDMVTLYRIPLSHEHGKEQLQLDRKEKIYKEEDWEAVFCYGEGNYLLFEDDKGCFILDQDVGKKYWIIKNKKNMIYQHCGEMDPWITPQGDAYVVLKRYRNGLAEGLYAYRMGDRNIQEITDSISCESKIAAGEGKIFYTGLVTKEYTSDYSIYAYDFQTGKEKMLASERVIREALPQMPSENADFMREMVCVKGQLYLEIRFDGRCYVCTCTPDRGSVTLLEDIKELARHQEYHLEESVQGGNRNYTFANDTNLFERSGGNVIERTLDGKYIRTIHLEPYYLLCANNEELIYEFERDPCGETELYSVPLTKLDGNAFPEINRIERITRSGGSDIYGGRIYADKGFLVYVAWDGYEFKVYDRMAKKFLDIANVPSSGRYCLKGDTVFACGDVVAVSYFIRGKNSSGVFLYRCGERNVTCLDDDFVDGGLWDQEGKTLIYQRINHENKIEWCSHEILTDKDTVLFTEDDVQKILGRYGKAMDESDLLFTYSCLVDGQFFFFPDLYYTDKIQSVLCYSLKEKTGLKKAKWNVEQKKEEKEQRWAFLGSVEGKVFLEKYQVEKDEEDDYEEVEGSAAYYSYDPATGNCTEIKPAEGEWLILSLLCA